jgi:hypothetical protein
VNNKLKFSSKKDLQSLIDKLNKIDKNQRNIFYNTLYKKNFVSKRVVIEPRFLPDNYPTVNQAFSKNNNEEESQLIADPIFASLINSQNEIIVADSLYKITEKGLFFSDVRDSIELRNFVLNFPQTVDEGVHEYNKIKTFRPIINNNLVEDETNQEDPYPPYDSSDSDLGSGSTNNGNGNNWSYNENIRNILSNLPTCEGESSITQEIFGEYFKCINYYDNRHRTKLEYWNQKWYIYSSVGIQIKKQTRRLQVWWASEAKELYLGINKIYLKYSYPEPNIDYHNNNDNYKKPAIYMYRGNIKLYKTNNGFGDNYYANCNITVSQPSLPFFDFGTGEEILNIYIPNVPMIDELNFDLNTNDLTSQANIKKLYQMGIDFLNSMDSTDNKFVITHQKSNNEIEVLYFDKLYHKMNDNNLKVRFYKHIAFKVGFTININNNGTTSYSNFTLSPVNYSFANYKTISFDFYGMAKNGNNIWKGNRMIRTINN